MVLVALALVALALVLAACGASRSRRVACASRNPPDEQSYEGTRAKVGEIVYVVLIEPERYASPRFPESFPWTRAVSSNPSVLRPIKLCESGLYSVPVEIYAFKAMRSGIAMLNAPLTARWRSGRLPPHREVRAYRRTIVIT